MKIVVVAFTIAVMSSVLFTSKTTAYSVSYLTTPERVLAYHVRIERGEIYYHLSADLERVARIRAYQISRIYRHDLSAYWYTMPCTFGEILAHVMFPYSEYRQALNWVVYLWNQSPTHQPLLDNVGHVWKHYGVGAKYYNGYWYFVVNFKAC